MYSKEKSTRNKTAIASGSGQSQPKPTGKKAEDLTPEEWEDINFGYVLGWSRFSGDPAWAPGTFCLYDLGYPPASLFGTRIVVFIFL